MSKPIFHAGAGSWVHLAILRFSMGASEAAATPANAKTIGECVRCQAPTSKFENCSNPSCRTLTLYCAGCAADPETLRCPDGCAA